jgi:hypothetical protein
LIPKIIHYCWFGEAEMPAEYKANIEGWGILHPGWKIMRWDESNIGTEDSYIQAAIQKGNWANASNYVRLKMLEQFGGVYIDTDFRLLKALDELCQYECFLGFESGDLATTDFSVNNAIMGSCKRHPFTSKSLLSLFSEFDGTEKANLSGPVLATSLLKREYGLNTYGRQLLQDVMLFEKEVFYPLPFEKAYDALNSDAYATPDTIGIHLWGRSWYNNTELLQRIDDQDRFIKEQLEYIVDLEGKLNGNATNLQNLNGNSYVLLKQGIVVNIENKLNKLHMNLSTTHEQLNHVNNKTSLIEKKLNEKQDDRGIFFAIEFLSSALKDAEKRITDLHVHSSVMENKLQAELKESQEKITTMNGLLARQNGEHVALKKEISGLVQIIEAQQKHFEKTCQDLIDFVKETLPAASQQSTHEATIVVSDSKEQEETLPVTETVIPGELARLQSLINKLEEEKEAALRKVDAMQQEVYLKQEENEKLNFRVSSLSTYIDTFGHIRNDMQHRILLLENLVQKMRIKNRVKRIVGLYKG